MKKWVIILLLFIPIASFSQGSGTYGNPLYSDRIFVSYDGNDTLWMEYEGDTIKFYSTDSVYFDKLINDISFGSSGQIPYTNSTGVDFNYSSNISWSGKILHILSGTGSNNVFVGYQSANSFSSGTGNSTLGYQAGQNASSFSFCTLVGYKSGNNSGIGNSNTFIGYGSGFANTGSNNSCVGYQSGLSSGGGSNNIYIGYESGEGNTGSNNVIIGRRAGLTGDGSGNVFIGDSAGFGETGDSLLYIDNTSTSNPLIKGDFANDSLNFNGKTSSKYFIGQLYNDGDSTLSIPATGTYYTYKKWVTDISENTTLTDSTITVAATGNGYYAINGSFSFTHSANLVVVHFSLFINDVEFTEFECQRQIGTGGDVGNAGTNAILWLDDSDVLKIKFKADKTGTITMNHSNFNIKRIN